MPTPALPEKPPTLVHTPARVARLCDALAELDRVGVDTEFHAERRYRPQLMLVQLAADDGRSWLVDPLTVAFGPVAAAMTGKTWVAFAGTTDVALLRHEGATPGALLDPQRLAGLTGHDFPRSLADLCAAELDLAVEKAPAMSDWSRRPLAEHQLRYAALDALLALRLWDALAARAPAERVSWAREDGDAMVQSADAPQDPDAGWRRLRVAPRLDAQARASLHRLGRWREAMAKEAGQPTWSILSDGLMLELARRPPSSRGDLAEHRRFPRRLLKQHGATLLRLVTPDDTTPIPPPVRPDRAIRATMLRAWSYATGAAEGVAPRLLLTDSQIDRLSETGVSALEGWRRARFGDSIGKFLRGGSSISFADGALTLT